MSHNTIDYVQQIRERGYRMTPQRQIVLDTVCAHGGHATASQIYDSVNDQQPAINRATVYRILDFFCELQLVAKADIGGRPRQRPLQKNLFTVRGLDQLTSEAIVLPRLLRHGSNVSTAVRWR